MYNYFRDVNDLVFLCVNDFQKECKTFVRHQVKKSPDGMEKIGGMAMGYINYFVEYPGIFELFYLTRVSDFGNKQPTIKVISTSLDSICDLEWETVISSGSLNAEEAEMMKSQLRYTVVGLLLLYLNRRSPDSYKEFIRQAKTQINSVLGIVQ
jgi:hypothetical protein